MLITMLTTFTLATSAVDVTPSRGKIEVKGVTPINNINYVETTEISDTAEIVEDDWNTYIPGKTQALTLAKADGANAIYLVVKDAIGNIALIYNGTNVEYAIEYNENGETSFTSIVANKADGITPAVRAMKSDVIYETTELTSMLDEYNMGLNDSKYEHLFVNESIYWLASQNDTNNLWSVSGIENVCIICFLLTFGIKT